VGRWPPRLARRPTIHQAPPRPGARTDRSPSPGPLIAWSTSARMTWLSRPTARTKKKPSPAISSSASSGRVVRASRTRTTYRDTTNRHPPDRVASTRQGRRQRGREGAPNREHRTVGLARHGWAGASAGSTRKTGSRRAARAPTYRSQIAHVSPALTQLPKQVETGRGRHTPRIGANGDGQRDRGDRTGCAGDELRVMPATWMMTPASVGATIRVTLEGTLVQRDAVEQVLAGSSSATYVCRKGSRSRSCPLP
jgi:hypothetical protein